MGGTQSRNIVDNTVNSFLNVCNDTISNLHASENCTQGINIQNCDNINLSDISMDCMEISEGTSVLTSQNYNDIEQKINESIEQIAKTINQNFSLNPTSTNANNTTQLVTNLGQSIFNTFKQDCKNQMVTNQTLAVSGCKDLNVQRISFSALQKSIQSCVGNSSNVTKAKQDLEQHLKQFAKSEVQNAIFWIILAIAGVFLAYGFSKMAKGGGGGGDGGEGKIIMMVLCILLEVYLYFECSGKIKFLHWCKTDKTKYISMSAVAFVFVILFILLLKKNDNKV